ncbi:THO complex subunit 2 [Cichlidogyrus casuarinus]|uniref:THO complex subunit 2 n=1 Tax=Cichlidogyrus casuarinus TaxID=1844966 RepID=A0ABD2QE46_9PLAT
MGCPLKAIKESSWEDARGNFCDLIIQISCSDARVDIVNRTFLEFKKAHQTEKNGSFESDLADSLWFIDSIIGDYSDQNVSDKFLRILDNLTQHVTHGLLMERLSEDTLQALSLIASKDAFNKRYVRCKTRIFFKQRKFNLLREESEGYAKLLSLLIQTNGPADLIMQQIWSLIGYFDLDPNRVLDIILDVGVHRTNVHPLFVDIFRRYNCDKTDLTNYLGHKFQQGTSKESFS